MNKTMRYKIWLREVSREFDIPQNKLLYSREINTYMVSAKQTFYCLCIRDKIDLYRLSEKLGKNRTTVVSSLKKTKLRANQEIINKIWNNVKTKESQATV